MYRSKLKRIIVLLLSALAAACLFLLVTACRQAPSQEDPGKTDTVTVILIDETLKKTRVEAEPGDPLPVLQLTDRDFVGYWEDPAYTEAYAGTVVPEEDITLYYKAAMQYYTLVVDYGDAGELSYSLRRGVNETLPSVSPTGMAVAGFAEEAGGAAMYAAGGTVLNLAEKGGSVTLYACLQLLNEDEFRIEDGKVVEYVGSSTSVTLPLGATVLAADAFADNPYSAEILSLTVPGSYQQIECGALRGLTGLESLTVPFIGGTRVQNRFLAYLFGARTYQENTYSFAGYSDGISLYLGDMHFESLLIPQTLRTVRVTEAISDFAAGAFYSAYGLENVVLDHPETLRRVGDSAFENCMSFGYDSSLGIPISPVWLKYVTEIGAGAFKSYTGNYESSVKVIYPYGDAYPDETAELLEYAYPFNNLAYIPALENIQTIGTEAFYYAAMLEDVTFGEHLETVGDSAFVFAISLGDLVFPDSTRSIGMQSFYATGPMSIEFGTGIRDIGVMAFGSCSNLSEVVFRAAEAPILDGGQSFSNTITQASSGNGFNIGFDNFGVYVPTEAYDSYAEAPTWAEYLLYLHTAEAARPAVYWSKDGGSFDAKFEFTGGSRVYVTDPDQTFITTYDYMSIGAGLTYGLTCGTYYPMMFEIIEGDAYLALVGSDSQPLYDNQYILHLWHPELLDYDGTPYDLYFIVTELPYDTQEGRVLVPVMEDLFAYDIDYGDTAAAGSYLISCNDLGIPQLRQVVRDGAFYTSEAIADPDGTYYCRVEQLDESYTFTYYDENFNVIESRVFIVDDVTGFEWDAPIWEKKGDYLLFRTLSNYNGGNQLFLRGDGRAYVKIAEGTEEDRVYKEYLVEQAAEDSVRAFGEEGFTVELSGFTTMNGNAVAGLTGSAVFYDYANGSYGRIELTVGSFRYMIFNVQYDDGWYSHSYDSVVSAKINMPAYSSNIENDYWRYTRFTTVNTDGSIDLYRQSYDDLATFVRAYYRETDAEGIVVSAGRVEYGQDGNSFTLVSFDGERRSAQINDKRGSFTVTDGAASRKFVRYDDSEDMTLVLVEDFEGYGIYYYTVKTDGYGNMYILDEHEDNMADFYLGTYDDYNSFTVDGANYYELEFTGVQVNADGTPVEGAEEVKMWVLYDFGTLSAWSDDENDAQWYGALAAIYTDHEDSMITVYDSFGYKLYELRTDVYGNTSYVQYAYTLDHSGKATYTALAEGDAAYFVAVVDAEGEVQYCIAVGSDGVSLFTVKPSESGSQQFVKVYDGGKVLQSDEVHTFTVDIGGMEKLEGSGASFGELN